MTVRQALFVLGCSLLAASSIACNKPQPQGDATAAKTAPVAAGSPAGSDGRQHRGPGGPGGRGGPPGDPAQMIARFDKNGDGKLQLDELPERMRTRMAEADTDKDGVLSVDELKAANKKRIEQSFARMDKNGDGSLTADEVGERRWAHLKDADANGDGKISLAEMQDAASSGKLRPPMRRGDGPGPGGGPDQGHDGDDAFGD